MSAAASLMNRVITRLVGLWTRLRHHEVGILGSVLALGGSLWVFFWLADEVVEGDTHAFDRAVLLALRTPGRLDDPLGPFWLEQTARDITSLGGYPVLILVTLAAIGFLLIARKSAAALLVLVSIGGGMLLSSGLKNVFDRTRPDLVPHAVEVYTTSFPSGHAMLSAVTYLTLGALLARVQPRRAVKAYLLTVAIALALLIGASRVYLGVHWPTDVLAGWCAGAAWAMLCWMVAAWLQRRGRVESDTAVGEPKRDEPLLAQGPVDEVKPSPVFSARQQRAHE
jgi:undecaprenyl-diphosphatase